ncbi:hypothetical protein AFM18_23700 [Achromobacter spanius]|uniref:Uncharacterized protein n=1 Tax=Achromobacter spanius TaxID=217203 RepID=A0AAW3HZ97_9BURK|nr:hypothetical protein AFM18_23700 [Achromobacter spanius]
MGCLRCQAATAMFWIEIIGKLCSTMGEREFIQPHRAHQRCASVYDRPAQDILFLGIFLDESR